MLLPARAFSVAVVVDEPFTRDVPLNSVSWEIRSISEVRAWYSVSSRPTNALTRRLSIGSQVVGQGLLVYAMGHLPPLVVGIGLLTQPVAAAALGWAVYDERLSLADGFGALLVCAALVLIRLPGRKNAA